MAHDPHAGTTGGLVGHDLNQACRLLDADVLRSALAERGDEHCVLAVSAPVYEGVVRHGHRGVRPELFRRADVTVKDGVLPAWIHQGAAADRAPGAATAPAAAPAAGSAPVPAAGSAPVPAAVAAPAPAPAPAGAPQAPAAGAVFHFHGAPVIHGSLVGGDQHGVSGGQVTGDVVLGGTRAEDDPTDGSRS